MGGDHNQGVAVSQARPPSGAKVVAGGRQETRQAAVRSAGIRLPVRTAEGARCCAQRTLRGG
ncbi:hypothetical protein A471_10073 [Ectopseudomonas mendocina DLHK]|nr:hypothetical protein A471_10073 [Pseudomonas mendocina DLHK]